MGRFAALATKYGIADAHPDIVPVPPVDRAAHDTDRVATEPAASPRVQAVAKDTPTWDAETTRRIAWLREATLPMDRPFRLMPGVTISDPALFFAALFFDIAEGPKGSRARYGALQGDLRRIEEWAASGYPTVAVVTRASRSFQPGEAARSIRLHIARGLPVTDGRGTVTYAAPTDASNGRSASDADDPAQEGGVR